jgi:membrane associated rhomboid family serine protease
MTTGLTNGHAPPAPDDPTPGETRVVRLAASGDKVKEWELVLASAEIPSRVDGTSAGFALSVAAEDIERAGALIDAFEVENRRADEPPWQPTQRFAQTTAGLLMASAIFAFYAISGPAAGASLWVRAGSANAERILNGEPWRVVTALMLHVDPAHLIANTVSGAIFATAVCRIVGPGLGAVLILLSGAGGNWLNAVLRGPGHTSVGASTAILGAVGILAGVEAVRILRLGARRGRAWLPLAASLALLALVGSDRRADLLAHFFGFVWGVGLGVAAATVLERPPQDREQRLLAIAAWVLVAGCWVMAVG